ncbi:MULTISPECIES: hypothetical protein [Xanthomonas]|uniref:hypothetical protein n=1 Tax=Xanthomonas TaxID=338 RepID=UPI001290574D|nr:MULTISPECIES: hypothetical protein [Xanthomonas]
MESLRRAVNAVNGMISPPTEYRNGAFLVRPNDGDQSIGAAPERYIYDAAFALANVGADALLGKRPAKTDYLDEAAGDRLHDEIGGTVEERNWSELLAHALVIQTALQSPEAARYCGWPEA